MNTDRREKTDSEGETAVGVGRKTDVEKREIGKKRVKERRRSSRRAHRAE